MAKFKVPRLTPTQQLKALQRDFSLGEIRKININHFEWEGELKSSPIGDEYLVKVIYRKGKVPKAYILEPANLPLPEGKEKLEHVYDHDEQRLCLYYPQAKEWNETKTLSSTIFPWIIEWLYHYEVWLITGIWSGGGIHPGNRKKEQAGK